VAEAPVVSVPDSGGGGGATASAPSDSGTGQQADIGRAAANAAKTTTGGASLDGLTIQAPGTPVSGVVSGGSAAHAAVATAGPAVDAVPAGEGAGTPGHAPPVTASASPTSTVVNVAGLMAAGSLAPGLAVGTEAVASTASGGSGMVASSPVSAAATQVAAALVGSGPIPADASGATGGTRLTIMMAPPAIGTVTVQIDTMAAGGTAVSIGATHPATLAALQTDHSALDQMLTQAGVALDHRSVSFHLEPVRQDASGSGTGGSGGSFGMSQGGAGQNGGQGGGQGWYGQGSALPGGGAGQGGGDRRAASGSFGSGEAAQGYDRQGVATSAAVIAAGVLGAGAGMQRFGLDVIA